MEPTFFQKHPFLKDALSLFGFVAAVVLGTIFLNTYIYRSYNVVGSSMANTMSNGDRVIVNRLAVTLAHFRGEEYVPERETVGPKKHTSGEVDMVVPEGELFVSGDNREGQNSLDSRSGLGTIPYCRIMGPVLFRLYPFDQMRGF